MNAVLPREILVVLDPDGGWPLILDAQEVWDPHVSCAGGHAPVDASLFAGYTSHLDWLAAHGYSLQPTDKLPVALLYLRDQRHCEASPSP